MSDMLANVPFRQIDNTDLAPIAVVAQCLDNQWVPRDLLADMLNSGWSLGEREVTRRRLELSRHEYLRSILNAQQVIINRAFFFNNPTVYRDFLKEGSQRSAFLDLLSKAVLVPFLLQETRSDQCQRGPVCVRLAERCPRGSWPRITHLVHFARFRFNNAQLVMGGRQ